ncbi:site-2 protease family protein, partial [Alphaproteobacteria bacterium]|nr:site-2 protease family protein [Alphaproteobacteria bacterium]
VCNIQIDFDEYNKNEELYFYCSDCEYVIKANIPKFILLKELILFIINSILFLSIPLISLFLLEVYGYSDHYLPFIFLFSGSILSIAYHEFFHSITAFLLGDNLIFARRYLRFDIRKYFHSFTSFLMPAGLFFVTGLFLPGAAVFFDSNKIKNRFHLALVSMAGVIANLIILILISFSLNHYDQILSENTKVLLHTLAFIQIIIIVFNLLPIPPLDGWGVVSQIFSKNITKFVEKCGFYILISFIALAIYYDLFLYLYPFYNYLINFFNLSEDFISKGWSYLILYDPENIQIFLSMILDKLIIRF